MSLNLHVIGRKINVRCLSYRSLYQVTPLKLMTFMFGVDVSRLVGISIMPHHWGGKRIELKEWIIIIIFTILPSTTNNSLFTTNKSLSIVYNWNKTIIIALQQSTSSSLLHCLHFVVCHQQLTVYHQWVVVHHLQ